MDCKKKTSTSLTRMERPLIKKTGWGMEGKNTEREQRNKQGRMEEAANQPYRRPHMTGQARHEEEGEEYYIKYRKYIKFDDSIISFRRVGPTHIVLYGPCHLDPFPT